METKTWEKFKSEIENLNIVEGSISQTVVIDLPGYEQAGFEDCEEQFFTLDGKEVTNGSTAE